MRACACVCAGACVWVHACLVQRCAWKRRWSWQHPHLNSVAWHTCRRDSARVSAVSGDDGTFGILEHDYVFWLGDLNYRIVEGISVEQVLERVAGGDLDFLRDRDQLNVERAAGRVFAGFNEGRITFLPTYKYQVGTDVYVFASRVCPLHCSPLPHRSTGTSSGQTRRSALRRGVIASFGSATRRRRTM